MGEYCHDMLGRYIVLYYGSFAALLPEEDEEGWKDELFATVAHEFTHHMEETAGLTPWMTKTPNFSVRPGDLRRHKQTEGPADAGPPLISKRPSPHQEPGRVPKIFRSDPVTNVPSLGPIDRRTRKEATAMAHRGEDLYEQHAQLVYRYLFSLCRDADLAEELCQETFCQALRQLGSFRRGLHASGMAVRHRQAAVVQGAGAAEAERSPGGGAPGRSGRPRRSSAGDGAAGGPAGPVPGHAAAGPGHPGGHPSAAGR